MSSALRLVRLNPLARFVLLVRGQDRIAAELRAIGLGVGAAASHRTLGNAASSSLADTLSMASTSSARSPVLSSTVSRSERRRAPTRCNREVVSIEGESYRAKEAKERAERKAAKQRRGGKP
jgi:hypothetical protein